MPEEDTKRKKPESTRSITMNPEDMDKEPANSGNNEEKEKPSRDPIDNDNNGNENIVTAQKDNEADLGQKEITRKPPIAMERKNVPKRGNGAIGKFSDAPKNIIRPTRRNRTIPETDNLGVRYVKMRHHKMEDLRESEESKESERSEEMPEISEKVLEGILGVKAERKEGERWVKLSEVDLDDVKQDVIGGKTENDGKEMEGREEKLSKSALNLKTEREEEEGSFKLSEVDADDAKNVGKGGKTTDDERETEGREEKLFKIDMNLKAETKEGERATTSSEVDVGDAKNVGKGGKTKDDERESEGREDKLFKNILDFKTEKENMEKSVKLSEVDDDNAKKIRKGGKAEDYEREMEGRADKLFRNIVGFIDERKERDRLREVVKDEEEDNKAKNDRRDDEERKENGGGKKSENREEKSSDRKFSADKMGARLVKTRNSVRTDCITLAKGMRTRRKERHAALKYSFEKRVESAERILEDRVGNFLEETAEKHPWLQPIESWIVDRYKSARSQKPRESVTRSLSLESEPENVSEKVVEEEKGDDATETDSGEVFIVSVKKSAKKNDSASSSKDSMESSPELSREKGNGTKDETTAAGKIEKVEKSHHVDLLDKLRDGFKEKVEDVQRYFQRTSRLADVNRKLKSQIWSSVVTIVLVEAKNLLPMDIDGLSDPYVKFRLGTEKYKSKVVNKTLSPVWLEQFDLHLYEDPYLGQELEVTVWDRDKSHQDDLMGRTTIDLASMERETTHRLWRDLEDGAGNIYLLLTISGTTASETISDLAAHEETPQERSRLLQKYSIRNSLQRPRDVGHLTVKVYRAQGLAAADLGGKSDPFCVLELVNARLQTQTEYKTLAPNWQKIFTFNVKDINSVLEVTVYDEDRDHKVEFLGRVAIPLLRIRNAEKRWYALKDKKLRGRAKGNSPQIMLEMIVVWNVLRACARTLNPKEKKYMEPEVKFKRQVFLRNVLRLKAIIVFFIDMGKYIQSCWEWESKTRSIVALVLFVLLCYYFEPWMIPTAALLILMKYCMVAMLTGGSFTTSYQHSPSVGQLHDSGDAASDEGPATPGDDDDDEDDKDKEEKKSLKERLQAIQEVTQTVQNSIGYIASLCERIKNLFNFTVPYLSYLAMILTILGVIVLYFIPMRYLILAWGVNKFLRKLLRPHSVPNNEVLDLISRVPDDEDLLSYRELKPVPTADCERGGTSSTSSAATATTRRDLRKKHKAA